MFELLFPIFCFGLVVTAIVLKGLLLAAEENQLQTNPGSSARDEKIVHAFRTANDPNERFDSSTSASFR
jgi:hypothetical protein